jgi:hypothetical protein
MPIGIFETSQSTVIIEEQSKEPIVLEEKNTSVCLTQSTAFSKTYKMDTVVFLLKFNDRV